VQPDWVCEIIQLGTLDEYFNNHEIVEQTFQRCKDYIGGRTPLNKAFKVIDREFHRLTNLKNYKKPFLILVSDGIQTDSSNMECLVSSSVIKNSGAIVLSCFLSDDDIYSNKRIMYGNIRDDWTTAVKLMWKYSSQPLEGREKLLLVEDQLKELDWVFEENYKLFVQLNSEEVFKEFLHFLDIRNKL